MIDLLEASVLKRMLEILVSIRTERVAAHGLPDEANAISRVRVALDQLLKARQELDEPASTETALP